MEMINIQTQIIKPAFSRPHPSNIVVFDVDTIRALVPYPTVEHRLVEFQPNSFAANHKHIHQESMCASGGELTLYYLDALGKQLSIVINPSYGDTLLITVPSLLPHAVINHSSHPSMLMYWTDIQPTEAQNVAVYDIRHLSSGS